MTPEEQYNLITKNLQEVLNPQIIKNVLEVEKRPLKIYWGMLFYRFPILSHHFLRHSYTDHPLFFNKQLFLLRNCSYWKASLWLLCRYDKDRTLFTSWS